MGKLSCCIAALGVPLAAFQVTAQSSADRQLAVDVDAMVEQLMKVTGTVGLAVAVVKGDQPILVKGYGYADLERKQQVSENTVFYIASTTKAFTALTLALLADRKLLDLDAPISRYLKDVQWGNGINPDSITLRHLLSHTHGIANSGPVVWRTAFTGVHTNPLLKELLQYHGASEAGRNFRYTNVGYNIAGLIIDEVIRGKWQDVLAETVMNPPGMKNTMAYITRFDSTHLAMPYSM